MKLVARVVAPSGAATDRQVGAEAVRLGRDPACEVAVDPAAYPKVSGLHARIEERSDGFVLVHLSRSNMTLVNGVPVGDAAPVQTGDKIRLGATGPTVEILALEPSAGPNPVEARPPASIPIRVRTTGPVPVDGPTPAGFGETVQADAPQLALLRGTARASRFELGDGGVIGRDPARARFVLDHPHVSRAHARVARLDEGWALHDLGSANGTYVNGRRAARPVALAPGDRVDVGPYALEFDGAALVGRSRANDAELAARDVSRVVRDRATGRPLTLLDGVSLVVRPGEFVCLLGPSGSGKSTLLAMLSGRAAPDAGTVAVNGRDLYAHFAALKQDIAVVPQKDVLHDTLTLGRALRYTAELRLPPDTARAEIDKSVDDILGAVGLSHRRDALIRHLSGGQVKRTSLANELLCRPSLLFLDEVTSGLDEQTDRGMMDLFRAVAGGGKTVVCVTHNLANVEAACHLVVILTAGGRLAFVGTPAEARAYFDVARLGDVYRRLADRTPEAWQEAFRLSPQFARYVGDRLPPDDTAGDSEITGEQPVPAGRVRQWSVLVRRYVSVWRGDVAAVLAMLGQSLLVAVLMVMVFGHLAGVANPTERAGRTVNLLFLLAVSSFWLGCNNAAKELVKERTIFRRERAINLRADSYYASKLLVLATAGAIQVALLFGLVRWWCGPAGDPARQFAVLVLLAFAGTAVGLLVSALARTEEVAIALVPVVVIPQIILAGVIAPLSGVPEWLARAGVTTYWGYQGMERLLPDYERAILGLRAADRLIPVIAIGIQTAIFVTATLGVVAGRDRQTEN